jgi:hypothetical protein
MSIVYKAFDANQDGAVSFMEFIQALRVSETSSHYFLDCNVRLQNGSCSERFYHVGY